MFLIYGSDNYIIKKQVNKIIDKTKSNISSEIDLIEYSLKEDLWEKIKLDIKTISLFSEHKVFIIKDAYFFTEKGEKLVLDFNVEDVKNFFDQNMSDVTIIFTLTADKISKRLNIVKAFESKGKIIALQTPDDKVLKEIIIKKIKSAQINYDDNAIDLLIEKLPTDMNTVNNEINKLILLNKFIDINLVNEVVIVSLEYDIFVLSNHLINGNKKDFIKLWNNFETMSKDVYSFIMLIFTNLVDTRNVLFYKDLNEKSDQIAERFKMNPYRSKIFYGHRRYTWQQINEKISKMNTLIYNINSGLLSNNLVEINLLKIFD